MRIIIDGMGGDNAPGAVVRGAVLAAAELEGHEIVLVGKEEELRAELEAANYEGDVISIRHAGEVIENTDSPVKAVLKKKDSSLAVGLNMLKSGEGDLFISAGNTGALMAGSKIILDCIDGIDRPAITALYPVLGGEPILLLDAGANSEVKPRNYLQFAIMGSIYMEKVVGRLHPRVGLVNIGAEPSKGTQNVKEAYKLLSAEEKINFFGNVEARDVPFGVADIVVCDGFTGNVILKLTEGLGLSILRMLKHKLTDSARAKLGALILMDKIKEIRADFDYSEYGGAPILGVKGAVIKMHGSSDEAGVRNTIIKALPYARKDVISIISAVVSENALKEA